MLAMLHENALFLLTLAAQTVGPCWFWCPYMTYILAVLQTQDILGTVTTELTLVKL